jgi:CPA2 family monovalent cation:H+ antiporter-2
VTEPSLLIELGGVILALGILGRFAGRLGISAIPLYLVAGLAFGEGGILPLATSGEFIDVGAEIGVILLLLLLGLEYSAAELVGNLQAQARGGALDLLLNGTPGFVLGLLLGWSPVAALAMGGVTYASSSGIVAKVLSDLGRLGNRETPVVLSLLVLEDLVMALYLPILTALLAGLGLLRGVISVSIALATVGVVLVVALTFGEKISDVMFDENDEVLLLRVLGLALLVAGVAAQLQVSAAVGAFLVGIALSGEVAESARAVLTPLRDLFAAVFFVFFGLSTNPADMPPVLLPAFALAIITMATKVLTGYIAAKRVGIAVPGRLRAGLALMPRGEFSVVIAGLAVASGVEPRLAPLATAYVLITVVTGPMLARLPDYPWFKAMVRRRTAVRRPPEPLPAGDGAI